jgi:hypothetical protein
MNCVTFSSHSGNSHLSDDHYKVWLLLIKNQGEERQYDMTFTNSSTPTKPCKEGPSFDFINVM